MLEWEEAGTAGDMLEFCWTGMSSANGGSHLGEEVYQIAISGAP
jgi:hypothetical protein